MPSQDGQGVSGPCSKRWTERFRRSVLGPSIAIGIAFGVDENKQNIGDILLSSSCVHTSATESERTTSYSGVLAARIAATPQSLSGLLRPSGLHPVKSVYADRKKLVDNVDYRSQLLSFESEAIGGEMEGRA